MAVVPGRRTTQLRVTTMLYGTVGAAFLSVQAHAVDNSIWYTPTPMATTLPAVDGTTSRVEPFAGTLANLGLAGAQGAFTAPISRQFGAQLDGAFGTLGGNAFGNVAGHLFWRDPGVGLLGLYTRHTLWDRDGGVYVGHIAGEAEYYYGRFTFQGIAGIEYGNSAWGSPTSVTAVTTLPGPLPFGTPGVLTTTTYTNGYVINTRFFDEINFKYYFTDDWNGYVGHRYLGGKNALALGSEYALPLRDMKASLYFEARVGEANFNGIWGGVRVYFDQHDKPLIARHRQDDPNIWGPDSLFSITNSQTSGSSSTSAQYCSSGVLSGGFCENPF
jgi:hypothetical protein